MRKDTKIIDYAFNVIPYVSEQKKRCEEAKKWLENYWKKFYLLRNEKVTDKLLG